MRRIAFATAVTAGLSCTGCMTVAPIAGPALVGSEFTYSAGRAWRDFAVSPRDLQAAVVGAMDDLRIGSVRETHEDATLIFSGTTADERRVSVTVRPNRATSSVSARIGWFGDEPLSRALMDRIGIRLGTLPPSAIPVDPPSSPGSNPYFSRSAIPDSTMLREQADAMYRDTPVP